MNHLSLNRIGDKRSTVYLNVGAAIMKIESCFHFVHYEPSKNTLLELNPIVLKDIRKRMPLGKLCLPLTMHLQQLFVNTVIKHGRQGVQEYDPH